MNLSTSNSLRASCLLAVTVLAGGCQTNNAYDKPSESVPTTQASESLNPEIYEILSQRKTINPFKAWKAANMERDIFNFRYGLYWNVQPKAPTHTLILSQINWQFSYPRYGYDDYEGFEEFLTNVPFGHDKEYGETYSINLAHPDYASYMANVAYNIVNKDKSHGIMLDWWIDSLPNNFSNVEVRKARKTLLEEYRKLDNHQTIVLGNVNDRRDLEFARLTNGVFLENWKRPFTPYSQKELFEMEKTVEFFDKNLLEPRLVALNAWKLSDPKVNSRINRQSKYNRQMAHLFTAMSAVIPENGYILYGDNNQDEPSSDHDHDYYDFYSVDLGGKISDFVKVKRGVGYKKFELGIAAYNLRKSAQKIKLDNGVSVQIEARSGLFCILKGNNCTEIGSAEYTEQEYLEYQKKVLATPIKINQITDPEPLKGSKDGCSDPMFASMMGDKCG